MARWFGRGRQGLPAPGGSGAASSLAGPRGPQARAAAVLGALLGAAALLVAAGAASVPGCAPRGAPEAAALGVPASQDADDGRDWASLLRLNPDIAGWLTVQGTDIDVAVVRPRAGEEELYLSHDLARRPDARGTPFLDVRSVPGSPHLLVYGHRLGPAGGQFSALRTAWEQAALDALGAVRWEEPDGSVTWLRPLCGLRVPEDWPDIQRFCWDGTDRLGEWLCGLAAQASARNEAVLRQAPRATCALTLCTCASALPGQPWRTLVVCCAGT